MTLLLIILAYALLLVFVIRFFQANPKSPEQQAREDEEEIRWLMEWKARHIKLNLPTVVNGRRVKEWKIGSHVIWRSDFKQ